MGATKVRDYKSMVEYLALLDSNTLVDVFERPDDDEVIHTYVATGIYKASMADNRIFSGYACNAISHFSNCQV